MEPIAVPETNLAYLVSHYALAFDIDPKLIASIILQESSADPWVSRYEERFYIKYVQKKTRKTLIGHVPNKVSLITEKLHRATSWGPMQVMGQVAREYGYAEDSLSKLGNASLGIFYGCMKLKRCLAKTRSLAEALLMYNGGANPLYDDEVLGRMKRGEYIQIIGKVAA